MANRLAGAMSPYLLQHAQNPVDWWPWCDEAFARARQRDVPVLLSVGYAACHWCHVMAHESFEDPATAALLNARFVSIKVDREERPDIDSIYMEATQVLSGSGGWPMTVFLDHDGRAFYAGTYFPPQPRHGMPSFGDVLRGIDRVWRTERDRVRTSAERLDAALREAAHVPAAVGHGPPAPADVRAAVDGLAAEFDAARGGFGGAPKFPPSMVLEFLLRADALLRRSGQPDDRALAMAARTMTAMARGGMYDQLAGGFSRYSVDADWVVPHFEKMLYDNALLLRAYLHWWRATGDPLAHRVVEATAQFLLTDLLTDEGGFASSLDADSGGREGASYVWSPEDLVEVLGSQDGRWVADLCGVTRAGTFEAGASVLQLRADPDDQGRWERCRDLLRQARSARVQPSRDDKVVAAWNGLAIAALAEAGALLGRPAWVESAERCADHVLRTHRDPRSARLARISLGGRAAPDAPGVLEDHADLAEGLLALYQVTGRVRWLGAASELLGVVVESFADGHGGFFDTAADAPALVRRPRDPGDGVTPSGTSAAAHALLTLAALTGEPGLRDVVDATLAGQLPLARSSPRFTGWTWATIVAALAGPAQVAIVLPADAPAGAGTDAEDLHLAALRSTSPGLVVAVGREGASDVPLLAGRTAIRGTATAYPCRGFVCDLPVTATVDLSHTLGDVAARAAG